MRQQRRAHDVEGVAVTAFLGIDMREVLQAFGLGFITAPGGGEVFKLLDQVGALEIADLVAQHQVAQTSLRGVAAVTSNRRRAR